MNKWKEIWEKRLVDDNHNDLLSELIRLDGFDGKTGKIELSSWLKYFDSICEEIGIQNSDSIFEVGCGSGAFLYPFYRQGHVVEGIDYSLALVNAANKLWQAPISHCEAKNISLSPQFDVVVSNSVFFYFPDLEYAESVIEKMINKSRRIIAILELPNKDLEDVSEKARMDLIGHEIYDKDYKELKHLYYSKNWMYQIGQKFNLKVKIFDQIIENYNSNQYRFNCIFYKED